MHVLDWVSALAWLQFALWSERYEMYIHKANAFFAVHDS